MCKLEEEKDLNIGKLIYLDIRTRKKTIFSRSNIGLYYKTQTQIKRYFFTNKRQDKN